MRLSRGETTKILFSVFFSFLGIFSTKTGKLERENTLKKLIVSPTAIITLRMYSDDKEKKCKFFGETFRIAIYNRESYRKFLLSNLYNSRGDGNRRAKLESDKVFACQTK